MIFTQVPTYSSSPSEAKEYTIETTKQVPRIPTYPIPYTSQLTIS